MDGENKDPPPSGGNASNFVCRICLDIARSPVVTYCGHLYCWPCLQRWMRVPNSRLNCPVCNSAVDIETDHATVTPIYGCDVPEDPSRLPAKQSRRLTLRQLLDEMAKFVDIRADRFLEGSLAERLQDLGRSTEETLREYYRRGVESHLQMTLVTIIPNSGRRVVGRSSQSDGVYQNTRLRARRRLERDPAS